MVDFHHIDERKGPLSRYRILEFAANYTVPYGGMLLGDQGAEVIKVELMGGDQMRYASSSRGGVATYFINANRNKRSICLNMKDKEAVEIFNKLVKNSDVVLQNFRPGVVDRLGVGYEDLKKIRDDIIMISVSGFGTDGPYRKRKAYDGIIQCLTGMASLHRDEDGAPTIMKSFIADKVTGLAVWQAATAALLSREHTGKGQHVVVNMLDLMVSFMWPDMMANQTFVGEGATKADEFGDMKLIYKTKDDYIMAIFTADQDWRNLVAAVGRPELATDRRFSTISARAGAYKEIFKELENAFLSHTTEEWMEILNRVDGICAPINTPETLCADPQVIASQLVLESEHPVWGTYRQPVPPIKFADTPASIRRHAPLLGEHSEQILNELGFTAAEVEGLRKRAVINQV